ncbi:PREDICTED: guanylin-like [Gekko japonicus]|uniref:Guanylin n=1 Tax=Gekko japonicus TaxID=146911 RepID=A0ABM1KHY2_GEKJA|nr:PREDICTED: guanylin-like [Gekko japonicus]
MNVFLTVSLCLCALAVVSDGVTVKVGDYSFPLESVKKLKDFSSALPAQRSRSAVSVCDNPKLPEEFQVICTRPKARPLMARLEAIARDSEVCEICANIACSGC